MVVRLEGRIRSLMALLVCECLCKSIHGLEAQGYGHATVALPKTTINTIRMFEKTMPPGYTIETDLVIKRRPTEKNQKEWKPRDIEKAFSEHQIVPDVVDDPPVNKSTILFPLNRSPEFGNEMNLSIHKHICWAQWPGTMNDTYTLIYTIPDVPSRDNPTSGEYQVWVVGNIEGPIYMENGTLTEYIKPTHPNGTGLHRHVFLVYKQPFGRFIRFDEPFLDAKTRLDPRRYKFSTRAFARKYNLGKPAAGNFFLAY
ncbi:unnamed protein product [Bemisia tabaci]|uniref:Phosphatidylethanolamine-binding protein n=1 Tax=Bemisia tabaci TaxID=7038 RepID=A0A9P0AA74_BEMTA|nr:unnamed protein product [Bemisia tabaci]